MREGVLSAHPDYKRDVLEKYAQDLGKYDADVAQWEREKREAEVAKTEFKKFRPFLWRPSELYNGMIAPLIPFAIKGAIWYQGESNAGRAWQYRTLFADMIRNWRRDWGQGDFPFLLVQLAPYKAIKDAPGESDWAELREAQALATRTLPNVGMAVITDVGEEKDIHPSRKGPVGSRLALAARKVAYHEKIIVSGPTYRSLSLKGDQAIVHFDNVGLGLEAREVAPTDLMKLQNSARVPLVYEVKTGDVLKALVGFSVAGEDGRFHWANAAVAGNTVVVSSPDVEKPVAVRYGWADYPVVNLWNKNGLPASPFRTDNFPMTTAPKKN
jgi:sialate O-acetylesterase